MGKCAIGSFDRAACPLLAGLDEAEQEQRIRDDPRIRACIAAVNGEATATPEAMRLRQAYETCCLKSRTLDGPASPAS